MIRFIAILMFEFSLVFVSNAQIQMPENGFSPGWEKSEPMRTVKSRNLFDYIDGGAEIFLEYGFKELWIQPYQKGDEEISIELFQMECPASALGIYLIRTGNGQTNTKIPARNSCNKYQFTIRRGSAFIQINNYSGEVENLTVLTMLAKKLLKNIPDEPEPEFLNLLPGKNLVKGTESLIRGPISLQPVYTFGEGDILQLHGKIFGVIGDYATATDTFTLILIPYPSEKAATIAYRNLINHFDPYHKILMKDKNRFVFRDYQKKYGLVEKIKKRIKIKIKMQKKPA